MNRREFLLYSAFCGFSVAGENLLSFAQAPSVQPAENTPLKGLRMIDAHAHPDRLIPYGRTSAWLDKSSTLEAIKALGMAASSFAAVGDQVHRSQGRIKRSGSGIG